MDGEATRKRLLRAALLPLGALLVAGSLLAAPGPTGAAPRAPAWHARIVIPGDFGGLAAADGTLYAVRYAPHGPIERTSRLVRIDPVTGHVVAQSRILPGVSLPVFADGELWVVGVTWYASDADGEGPTVLTELNPATLRRIRQVPYPVGRTPWLVGATRDFLLESTTGPKVTACTLSWLRPDTGRAYRTATIVRGLGPCVGATLDSSGRFAYVMVDGPGYHTTLVKLDAVTGVIRARLVGDQRTSGDYELVATGARVWVGAGDPGANGFLLYYGADPLRLLAASCVDVCATKGRMPNFGEFPDLVLSAGRIWVASSGLIACFRPSSGRPLATAQQFTAPIVSETIVEARGRVWGSTSAAAGPPSGLVRLSPPRSCFGGASSLAST